MIYTIEEIRERIEPIAKEYGLESVILFGSYARGDAKESSDVDLLVETSAPCGLFQSEGIRQDFSKALGLSVDIVMADDLLVGPPPGNDFLAKEQEHFRRNLIKDGRAIYVAN